MKKLFLVVALFAVAALGDGNVASNTPNTTPVAVVSSQAATTCCQATAAAGVQGTCTVTGQAGVSFYVTLIEIQYGAIAVPAATLLATTSTNLPGSLVFNDAAPAAVFQHDNVIVPQVPIKTSTAGANTVLTGNAAVTSISQNIKMCGFFAQ